MPAMIGIDQQKKEAIITDLLANKDVKSIANKHKVEIGQVYVIQKANKSRMEAMRKQAEAATITPSNNNDPKHVLVHNSQVADDISNKKPTATSKRRRLSPDTVNQIVEDLKSGVLSQAQLAEMYDCCQSTISRIYRTKVSMYGTVKVIPDGEVHGTATMDTKNAVNVDGLLALPAGIENIDPNINPEVNEQQAQAFYKLLLGQDEVFNSMLSRRQDIIKYIRAGTIANRHEMPITKFVFNNVSDKLMFDYEKQLRIVKTFMQNNILFDGDKPLYGLELYVTGLQTAFSSILAVCADMNIDVTCMHYNNETCKYIPQVIRCSNPDNICPPSLYSIKRRHLYTYGCTITTLLEQQHNYEIIELMQNSNSTITRDITFFTDRAMAWEMFMALAERCGNNKNIYLNQCDITKNTYVRGKNICKQVNCSGN